VEVFVQHQQGLEVPECQQPGHQQVERLLALELGTQLEGRVGVTQRHADQVRE